MRKLLTWISRRRFPYKPLITVEISRKQLLENLREFKKNTPHGAIAPVLKSNAYGHGLLEIATILEKEPIPFLIVDSYFEAIALRSSGIKTPLLIIGYTQPETILQSRIPHISFTITNIETLRTIASTLRPILIHLKIDTGMHRQGILPEEVSTAIGLLKHNTHLILEGICTHLADSDGKDPAYTRTQITHWNDLVKQCKKEFPSIKWIHAGATYGHPFSKEIDANMSRLGIGLYGLAENIQGMSNIRTKPVLEMKTILTGIKTLKKSESIGYNNTFTAPRNMQVATIPAGYYEGIDRRLSNVGYVLIGPQRIPCPIVGRVSMNITSIDISAVPNAKIGDQVIIISNITGDPNSISEIVKKSEGTIAYEMAVKIPPHLKRVVVT